MAHLMRGLVLPVHASGGWTEFGESRIVIGRHGRDILSEVLSVTKECL